MRGNRSGMAPPSSAALRRHSAMHAATDGRAETTRPGGRRGGCVVRKARRVSPWVAAVTLGWSLAGCSGSSNGAGPTATATVSVTTTQTVTSTPGPEGSSTPPDGSTSAGGTSSQTLRAAAHGATYFETPSGNITCFLLSYDAPAVDCVVIERDFADPPRPPDCNVDWAPQFTLGGDSSYGACRGDADGTPTDTVLGYGGTAVNGPITCRSEVTGLSCTNDKTSHGFTISRATYRLF